MANIHSQPSPFYMYKFIFHNYSCRFPLCSAPALELESGTGNGLRSLVYPDSLILLVYFMLSPSSPFSLHHNTDTVSKAPISTDSKQCGPGADQGVPLKDLTSQLGDRQFLKCRRGDPHQGPVDGFIIESNHKTKMKEQCVTIPETGIPAGYTSQSLYGTPRSDSGLSCQRCWSP